MAEGKKRGGPRGGERGAPARPGAKAASPDGVDERSAQLAAPLKRVLQRLPETQRRVLELRMGLVDGHPQDPADAARTLGISLGELREIEARAFERIREVIPLQQLQRFLER
jgi:DNA-directed RNA polymerase sigma subunit (sigma70/sigma32)